MVSDFDTSLSAAIQAARTPVLDRLMLAFTLLGDGGSLIWIAVATVLALLIQRAWLKAGLAAAAFIGTSALVSLVKGLVGRARPTADLYSGVDAFSFPSGHMTNAAIILGVAAFVLALGCTSARRRFIYGVAVLLIVMVGLSRVYLSAHWPSDVLGGALLATAILLFLQPVLTSGEGSNAGWNKLALLATCLAIWTGHAMLSYSNNSERYGLMTAAVERGYTK
ncbi:PAP2 family protein [Henriciella mobilis]|nr:PAP2 family protein [Henriciella mobilis]